MSDGQQALAAAPPPSGIKRMSYRHDAIAEFLIAHPEKTLGECAEALGYTRSWLSMVIGSDIFQAYYQRLRDNHVDTRVMPLRDKVMGVAHQAVERLADMVEKTGDTRVVLDVADKMLSRLGYGGQSARSGITVSVPGAGGGTTVISTLTPEELEAARAKYRAMQADLTSEGIPSVTEPEQGALFEAPGPGGADDATGT